MQSRMIRTVARLAAVALAALVLHGCGGGGGSTSANEPGSSAPAAFATYRNTSLPGRLLVKASDGTLTRIVNLADGTQQALPGSTQSPEADGWDAAPGGAVFSRLNTASWHNGFPVALFNGSLANVQPEMALANGSITAHGVRPSADGRYLLTFFGDDRQLTIFNAATGAIVEQGSQLNGQSVLGFPAAWLPSGDYIYLVANKLYRTTPGSPTTSLIATLALPPTNDAGEYLAGRGELSANPAGTRIALSWNVQRGTSNDTHVYVADLSGSNLHRVTAVPDPNLPLNFSYGSPTWSPDGQYLAMVLFMAGVTVSPAFPQEDPYTAWRVSGTTGCTSSPVMVVSPDATNVAMSWPQVDPALAVKAKSTDGTAAQWITTCAGVRWVP